MSSDKLKTYITQFITSLFAHVESIRFIRKHKLWEGIFNYGWLSRILVILAVLFGLKFINTFSSWFDGLSEVSTANAFMQMGSLVGNLASESYNFLFVGGVKYIMLILLEVLIFHICRRCIEVLTGKVSDTSFNTFMKAQIRMIKMVIRSYIMEMIFTVLFKIFFGIFGSIEFLEPIAIFGVQCYYLGFLVMDNYLEQFNLSIKKSVVYAKQYIGVSLAVGLVLNVLLLIPALGPIIAPIIAAVTISLVMYSLSDIHITYETTPVV